MFVESWMSCLIIILIKLIIKIEGTVRNSHTIRRSIATNLTKSGVSLYDIMVLLNHSNIEQTMKYLNMEHNNLHDGVNSLMANIFNDF